MARILVVDDEPGIRKMLTRRLQRVGHEVFLAEDGAEGVTLARELQPDLVLLDMHMPVLDGYDAARTLRAGGYTGLISALTASAMVEETNKAVEAGCDVFITKPITADFEQRVASLLDLSDSHRHHDPGIA